MKKSISRFIKLSAILQIFTGAVVLAATPTVAEIKPFAGHFTLSPDQANCNKLDISIIVYSESLGELHFGEFLTPITSQTLSNTGSAVSSPSGEAKGFMKLSLAEDGGLNLSGGGDSSHLENILEIYPSPEGALVKLSSGETCKFLRATEK